MRVDQYTILSVSEPDNVVSFLCRNLGFRITDSEREIEAGSCVKNEYGNCLLIVREVKTADKREPVLINTPDCLQATFRLFKSGIRISKGPHYTSDGLMSLIADPYGVEYILLEKREMESTDEAN